jgi:hypothetical protein
LLKAYSTATRCICLLVLPPSSNSFRRIRIHCTTDSTRYVLSIMWLLHSRFGHLLNTN